VQAGGREERRRLPDHDPFPFGTRREIELLLRNILLPEYGERFRSITETEIEG